MPRKADALALPGSLADRLRARRVAVESGKLERATEAFNEPQKKEWADLAVDESTDNRKVTHKGGF